MNKQLRKGAAASLALAYLISAMAADAETLAGALALAYVSSPDLNQQRAALRVHDEDVPKAATGYRPKVSVSGNAGPQSTRVHQSAGFDSQARQRRYSNDAYFGKPRGATFGITQPLFDGFRTDNSIRQAESSVFAARAMLRQGEQTLLQKAATAYMDVMRDIAVVRLRKNNIAVLTEQLRQTRIRCDAGDVTFTDVAQAQASLAQARSDYYVAEANLKVSAANYHELMGVEPTQLQPPDSLERLLPQSVEEALRVALVEHPNITAAQHQADAASLGVNVAEGALLPTVSVSAQVNQQSDWLLGYPGTRVFEAQATVQLNAPIYQGGGEYVAIRQAKEQYGQARLAVDLQNVTTRSSVVSSYARLKAAKEAVRSGQEVVKAAQVALRGVRMEAFVGTRTTLDVLNAQQALLDARVKLVGFQHDVVVASYASLAAIGRLTAEELELAVPVYDPNAHLEKVRDQWIGWSISD